ncbi:MAG: hypothetical protein K2N32_05700, partial [Clostridia bacterium]|nr:hypothetical protein [Clostridia bacterium]
MDIRKKKLSTNLAIVTAVFMALVFSCVGVVFCTNKTTQAIISSNIDTESTNLGEMLLEGYENDTTGKGNIFDGKVFWGLIKQVTGEEYPSKDIFNNLGSVTRTSEKFRDLNEGNDVVVTIGGKKWIATYLSTNRSNEPILTLWLANSASALRWNETYIDKIGKYPSNMYGTSEMRAVTLNNGGGYAVNYNDEELTLVDQDATSEWAIYTMPSVKGSLTSFIEVPDNMSWQRNQVAQGNVTSSAYTDKFNYNNNNDALYIGGNGTNVNFSTNESIDNEAYKDWANDRLWLPSIAETGVSGVEGIWKADNSTRANSIHSWLRSAYYSNYFDSYALTPNGEDLYAPAVTRGFAVRPAFHLNLKFAAERAGVLGVAEPNDVAVEYTGENQTIANVSTEQKSWYNSGKIILEYPSGGMVDAKTYTVTAKIKDN